MELVTAGNPNLGTIKSVLHVVPIHYQRTLTKVFFIDSDFSQLDFAGRSILGDRFEAVQSIAGKEVQVSHQFIGKNELAAKLPEVLSTEMHSRDHDDIVIDLTNGTKSVSSLLYAAGSLLKVKRLFFLTVTPEGRKKDPREYTDNDYVVQEIDPLQNILELGKYGYFDLVYYRDSITSLARKLANLGNHDFTHHVEQMCTRGMGDYFKGDYMGCISEIGKLSEEFALLLVGRIRRDYQGEIKRTIPYNFNDAITFLSIELCDKIRGSLRDSHPLDPIQAKYVALRNVDKSLDILRCLRNESVHPRKICFSKAEAKMCLDSIIAILTDYCALETK
jgi:hypothetical protein